MENRIRGMVEREWRTGCRHGRARRETTVLETWQSENGEQD